MRRITRCQQWHCSIAMECMARPAFIWRRRSSKSRRTSERRSLPLLPCQDRRTCNLHVSSIVRLARRLSEPLPSADAHEVACAQVSGCTAPPREGSTRGQGLVLRSQAIASVSMTSSEYASWTDLSDRRRRRSSCVCAGQRRRWKLAVARSNNSSRSTATRMFMSNCNVTTTVRRRPAIRRRLNWRAACDLPLLATQGAQYAKPEERQILDVFTCIRNHRTLDTAGRLLARNSERYIKTPQEMLRLFADLARSHLRTPWSCRRALNSR